MVASQHRISTRSDFSRTLRAGVRVSTPDLLVHVLVIPRSFPDPEGVRRAVDDVGGPWLGLIVSRAVGNAVVRHRVARRLRAAFDALTAEWPAAETLVVVRARASVATRSSTELREQLADVTTHRRVRGLSVGTHHLAGT